MTDELQITVRPLPVVIRKNWKSVLSLISGMIEQLDVKGVVLGLPLRLDGSEGDAAQNVRRIARNFQLSLSIPVYLQNESLTSIEASERLRSEGHDWKSAKRLLDSEAAKVILEDFLAAAKSVTGKNDIDAP